jgi:hypothetical protein
LPTQQAEEAHAPIVSGASGVSNISQEPAAGAASAATSAAISAAAAGAPGAASPVEVVPPTPLFVCAPGASLRSRISLWLLRRLGWRLRFGSLPGPRGVLIVYPHTSNWDFPIAMLARTAIALPIRWVGKETLFTGWFGRLISPFMRALGGRPVVRHGATGAVEQLSAMMRAEPWCWLGISPEGTRKHRAYWRSGFYHVALALNVPVLPAWLDYATREVGVGTPLLMSGDVEADMARLREAFAGRRGLYPAQMSAIAFKAESRDTRSV